MNVIGIVGTGVMGLGIAQIAALAGLNVKMFDAGAGVALAARERLAETLMTLVARGKLEDFAADAAIARLEAQADLSCLHDCDVIVEAIVERLDVKRQLFVNLESIVGSNAILASNTSSFSITAIASACVRPERVVGFHFFNPVPLMRIVEVVGGERTDPNVVAAMLDLGTRMGHRAVLASDTPGFIVNHAGRGYVTEAMGMFQEGVAPVETIDRILRAAGFRMGPHELLDLTGLDVSHPVMESIHHQFYGDPRYRPSYALRRRMEAGLLGRKAGRGFYSYGAGRDDNRSESAGPTIAGAKHQCPLWVWAAFEDWQEHMVRLARAVDVVVESGAQPSPEALCLVAPAGEDATTVAQRLALDPKRVVAVDMLGEPPIHTIMGTPLTDERFMRAAQALLESSAPVVEINDSLGFVTQRVMAMIVNIAAEMAQQRIASPEDIDAAVRLGLGYPSGPLEWGDRLGPQRMLAITETLFRETGDPRYRPSPWLMRRARLGVSLLHPDRLI